MFFYYGVVWVLHIFWILTPKSDIGWKYFSSHSIGCFSHRCLLLVSRSFLVRCSPTCFWFGCLCFRCHTQKIIAKTYVKELYPPPITTTFSSGSFMASGFTFKLLIQCKLIFVSSGSSGCSSILSHVNSQFSQHHYWKVFSSLSILASHVKYYLSNMLGCISGLKILSHWFVCLYTSTIPFWLL